jgi:hypothetical protein
MVQFNHAARELTIKLVYYGPGLSGKTTNLQALHERLDQHAAACSRWTPPTTAPSSST